MNKIKKVQNICLELLQFYVDNNSTFKDFLIDVKKFLEGLKVDKINIKQYLFFENLITVIIDYFISNKIKHFNDVNLLEASETITRNFFFNTKIHNN